MSYITSINLTTYTNIILLWGLLSIISTLALHFLNLSPLSNKSDNSKLFILGSIKKRYGWIIMEVPVLLSISYFYFLGSNPINASLIFVLFFMLHYSNRALIYPFRIKVDGKKMPVITMLASMSFYIINGYFLGYYFGSLREYDWQWLYDPRFIIGASIFVFGFFINITSDNILMNLRKPGETGYKIPKGGFFRFVSCPNYFGEILEWIGFAIMSWSLPGLIYAVWVALPLLAQGVKAHQWYNQKFEDYPKKRKAVIPYIL